MTDEQIREVTKGKVEKIKALCMELQIQLGGKQRLDPQSMTIENIVVFTDMENYPVAEFSPEEGEDKGTVVEENVQPEAPVTEENPDVEAPAL